MARGFALASLVVVGIIIADILVHPGGTSAASKGLQGMENSGVNGLLGVSPTGNATLGGT